jgi:DNA-binding transcriptional LysR family regulator
LRTLEREIGQRLVVRAGCTVAPTEFGIAILDCARHLLREARELTTVTVSDGVVGELRIGATSTALARLPPGTLASRCSSVETVTWSHATAK